MPIIVPARLVTGDAIFAAVAAIDDITGNTANNRTRYCSARISVREGITEQTAANCADRGACVSPSLAIGRFCAGRGNAQNQTSQHACLCAPNNHGSSSSDFWNITFQQRTGSRSALLSLAVLTG
jgi:hypothetical protein